MSAPMTVIHRHAVYGILPADLAAPSKDAEQCSPLVPGAVDLADIADATYSSCTMLAPPGTIERRYALAQALRTLSTNGSLTVLAPNDAGGSRLVDELGAFGCMTTAAARRHHKICSLTKPTSVFGLDVAIAAGCLQQLPEINLWSQPGIFCWDKLDGGTALLLKHLPKLAGRGADFGCGIGLLSLAALKSREVTALTLIDNDRRAIDAARKNVADPRATFSWADVRTFSASVAAKSFLRSAQPPVGPTELDFVVMNPPFHDGGTEDRSLGLAFLKRGADALRSGGVLWLTANRHLPYEAEMLPLFASMTQVVSTNGFKVYKATK
jgi:16S rRNA (guanine1207-N2)-methyltransferase